MRQWVDQPAHLLSERQQFVVCHPAQALAQGVEVNGDAKFAAELPHDLLSVEDLDVGKSLASRKRALCHDPHRLAVGAECDVLR